MCSVLRCGLCCDICSCHQILKLNDQQSHEKFRKVRKMVSSILWRLRAFMPKLRKILTKIHAQKLESAWKLFVLEFREATGCSYKLSTINLVWGPLKCTKSNFNPVHVFLHFKSFCLVVLQLILASKLSEWEQFENFAANYQFRKKKRVKMTQKSDWCHCQAIKRCLWVSW